MFDIKRGLEVLRQNVKIAPEAPGVYRMLNEKDEVLYVGKAKNIKKRIVAYTRIEQLTTRLQRMVAEVVRMEFIIVENENRALVVENELIKKLHPKYNILLKDDKSYPHLMLNLQEEYPALRKFRGHRGGRTVRRYACRGNASRRGMRDARSFRGELFCGNGARRKALQGGHPHQAVQV